VSFEDLVGVLRLEYIEFPSERLEVLRKFIVRYYVSYFAVFTYVWVSLSTKHEGHLLKHEGIFAFTHQFLNQIHVVHLLGDSEGIGESAKLYEYIKRSLKSLLLLLGVCSVSLTAK
jgi:hypothetical protein